MNSDKQLDLSGNSLSHERKLLLRACLLDKAGARMAWAEWRERVPDPIRNIKDDNCGLRRILPLLLIAARNNGFAVDGPIGTVLRTAYVREHSRMRTYCRILESVLETIAKESIDAIVLNGCALAHSVYTVPHTRHCHDIDILTTDTGLDRARKALSSTNLRVASSNAGHVQFEHRSNLPIQFYASPRYQRKNKASFAQVSAEASHREIGAHSVRILGRTDSLLQILCHPASQEKTLPLSGFCDAVFVIRQMSNVDWERFIERVQRFELADRVLPLLSYLRDVVDDSMLNHVLEYFANAQSGDIGSGQILCSGI